MPLIFEPTSLESGDIETRPFSDIPEASAYGST